MGLGPDGGDRSYPFVQRILPSFANAPDTGRAQEVLAHPLSQCLRFTYRTSPVTMVPEGSHGRVSWNRPPMEERGMIRLVLGHDGSLPVLSLAVAVVVLGLAVNRFVVATRRVGRTPADRTA